MHHQRPSNQTDGVANEHQQHSDRSTRPPPPTFLQFLFCVVGIYGTFLYFGYVQETLASHRYGEKQEKYRGILFLVFLQCLASTTVAAVAEIFSGSPRDRTPFYRYIPISLSYVFAMITSNMSIQYVNYPTMTLAKSCKPIPVLLMGLILGKKESVSRIFSVILISLGISMFSLDLITHSESTSTTDFGMLLLVISLTLDGFTGPFQDKLNREYHPTHYQLMVSINGCAALFLLFVLVLTGEFQSGVQMLVQYPEFVKNSAIFAFTGAIGQSFIYYCVVHFGSLICTLITTTRKFFSILFSVFIFGHQLSFIQWTSIATVFIGLGIDIVASNQRYMQYWMEKLFGRQQHQRQD